MDAQQTPELLSNENRHEDTSVHVAGPGNILVVDSGQIDIGHEYTELWMPDGQVLRVPTALLQPSLLKESAQEIPASMPLASDQATSFTIPLVEERIEVAKRTVATSKVRLQKTVQTYQETLDEPLAVRSFDVERVVKNEPVEVTPPVRQEGETTIYPLMEERLILTKQLILREELRITKRESERRDTQVVTLRREHLTVEREAIAREPDEKKRDHDGVQTEGKYPGALQA